MGLFDAFTGKPAKQAAAAQRAFLDQTRTQGNADIDFGYNTATGAVRGGASGARTALGTGYEDAIRLADLGSTGALNYIDEGSRGALDRLDTTGARASEAFTPLSGLGTKYGAGTSLLLDSYGVNGPEGNARAVGAFQAGPGYQFTLNEGIDAINRRRNAMGMAASGNADYDAINYATGLADKTYGDWRSGLSQFINPELSAVSGAATGRAGIERDLGLSGSNIINTTGAAKAGIESGRGAMLADLASRYGTNLAGVETGEGTTLANLATGAAGQKVGLATNLAQPYANTYSQEAQAQMAGSSNLWGLGLNLAKLGVSAASGIPIR